MSHSPRGRPGTGSDCSTGAVDPALRLPRPRRRGPSSRRGNTALPLFPSSRPRSAGPRLALAARCSGGLLATLFLSAGFLAGWLPASARAPAEAKPYADCLRLFRSKPDSRAAFCFFKAARSDRSWEEGSAQLSALLRDYPDNPWLLFNLGRIHLDGSQDGSLPGRETDALDNFRRAGTLFEAGGHAIYAGYAWKNAFRILRDSGRLAEAEKAIDRAIEVTRNLEDPSFRLEARIDLATLLISRGTSLEEARDLLLEVEAELQPAGGRAPAWKPLLLELGNVNCLLGRYVEGFRHFDRLRDLAIQEESPSWEAIALYSIASNQMAELLRRNGDPESSLAQTHQALTASQKASQPLLEAKSRLLLGKLDQPETRASHLRECIRISERHGLAQLKAQCQLALAAEVSGKSPKLAAQLARDSWALVAQAEEPWSRIFLSLDQLQVLWNTQSVPEATTRSMALLDRVESLRELQRQGQTRAELFGVWTPLYYLLAGDLVAAAREQGDVSSLKTAFHVSERMRARSLLESVSRDVDQPAPAEAALSLASEKLELSRKILDPDSTPGQRRQWLQRIAAIGRREGEGGDDGQDEGPVSRIRPSRDILDEIQRQLSPEEALLSFQISDWEAPLRETTGGSWLLLVTRDRIDSFRLPARSELERKVGVFTGILQRRDQSEAGPAAILYRDLLSEALSHLPVGTTRLHIIGDGPLLRLPFAALRPAPELPPLAQRYEISLIPSATLWRHWKAGRGMVASPSILAMVDPELPDGPEANPQVRRQAGHPETGLGRLPLARREGRVLKRLWGSGVRLLEGKEAGESVLKKLDLRSFGVVHFAAHALIDEKDPERSAIVLAPSGDEDGLLQSREIRGLRLGGKVVVLSACSGASGRVISGEGVLDLARAFFESGAPAVVANLWPVRDDDAEAFVERLYERLGEGATLNQSLRQAQLDRIEDGAPAAAWAGFVALGDGDYPLFVTRGDRSKPLRVAPMAAVAASLALFSALLLWCRRRRSP